MYTDNTGTGLLAATATDTSIAAKFSNKIIGEFVLPKAFDAVAGCRAGVMTTGLALEAVIEAGIPAALSDESVIIVCVALVSGIARARRTQAGATRARQALYAQCFPKLGTDSASVEMFDSR